MNLECWKLPTDEQRVAEIVAAYEDGRDTVLCLDDVPIECMADEVSNLGRLARVLCTRMPPAGMIVTGGWTGLSVMRELGAESVAVVEAVEEGVPLCWLEGGEFHGLRLVTKGGALGGEDIIEKSAARFRSVKPTAADRHPRSPDQRPILAVTMGDPCGVGAEVVVKALSEPAVSEFCRPLVVGHPVFLEANLRYAPAGARVVSVQDPTNAEFGPRDIGVWNPVDLDLGKIAPAQVCPEAGRGAVEWVKAAVDLALAGTVQAIVTAPLNKEAMNLAGYAYAGHTELLGDCTQSQNYRMLLASERLKVLHVTVHVALNQVPVRVTVDRVFDTIELGQHAMVAMGYSEPRIAVAGLNPHAGEHGLFGSEDEEVIRPAVEQAMTAGWNVTGPLPGDTLFHKAYQGDYDLVLAMFHDQGHIPIKLVAFADAVNVTLGLPIIRTSVDHGTAFDIVGQGLADHGNMVAAMCMAARLSGSPA